MMQFGLAACALLATSASAAPSLPLAPRQSPFQTTPIASFAEPWAIALLPDERILVTEKAGNLRLVNPDNGSVSSVSGVPSVRYSGQGGLGDVVLHPQFADNNLVYISYAETVNGNQGAAAVARAELVLGDSGGSLENLEVIWRQSQSDAGSGHYAHRILFAGNSTLYISSGDRQLFDPAQDMESNLGKVLRLNDDGTPHEGNPFAGTGNEVTDQIWALGIRNPLGIDFDAEGRLWEIEMGPRGGDEVNLIQPAANYGWPIVSNGDHYDGAPIPDHSTRPEFNPPKTFWNPVISPAGMIVYKGDLFPEWTGNILISAVGAQGIVRVQVSGESTSEAQRISMGRRMRGIREGPDGAIWMIEDMAGGRLLKLTPA